uniref:Uncharacterized protein n=1 Tax=Chenopodium quinoa TaxID=63459 RepID=A0A803LJN8_CHEQI
MLEMDGEAPSKLKMFERTRRRKEGRTYKTSADDTQKKIVGTFVINEAMRRLEASQVDVSDDSKKDPFDEVMKEDYNGYVRLIGKGVSRKKLKASGASNKLVFPTKVMETINVDVQKDMLVEKEELDKEKEAHAAKVAEFTEMQKNYEAQKESLAHEV